MNCIFKDKPKPPKAASTVVQGNVGDGEQDLTKVLTQMLAQKAGIELGGAGVVQRSGERPSELAAVS